MIPLISSLCYGPIGYCQLPRLWWKALLEAHGLLDPEYPACSQMLDSWLLEGLKIPEESFLGFIASERPNYLACEKWVAENAGRKPDALTRDCWNELIRTRIHRPAKFHFLPESIGLKAAPDLMSAVVLNHLEDWHWFYVRDFRNTDWKSGTVIPLISTLDYGRLGVCQLPRTWLKVILEARGWLHPDYPGCGNGLDAKVLKVLNLDREKTVAYLKTELPSYMGFERWIRKQTSGSFDRPAIEEWNRYLRQREHGPEKQKSIGDFLGLAETDRPTSAVVLNHLEDWEFAHRALVASGGVGR
ncbi:MAG: hypothetical protein R3F07_13255 [Opitutaceae bacterium]